MMHHTRIPSEPMSRSTQRITTLAAHFLCCLTFCNLCTTLSFGFQSPPTATSAAECISIPRKVPPVGIVVPVEKVDSWQKRLSVLAAASKSRDPDVLVLLKACRYAIENQELYSERDFGKVDRILQLADQRIQMLQSGRKPWAEREGLQVRGFRSAVDGSVQPLGMVFPEDLGAPPAEGFPLYVWLHGRGDKNTDLHFVVDRLDKKGQITPPGAIVVHPFGRQCIGYKSAGETDVMEAIDYVRENYPIDDRRIVLMGFSMGGAGVWHLAAHYTDSFVAASPGAGFAETARYRRLKPEDYPAPYVQTLWRVYDVPGYTRNLFNIPVVAYSGENDRQIQAARVMEEAYQSEGRELTHLIGPGMGHKYHPDTLKEILQRMESACQKGRPNAPSEYHLQTHHLRYGTGGCFVVDGVFSAFDDTRVDSERKGNSDWKVTTHNVSRLIIDREAQAALSETVILDDQKIQLSPQKNFLLRTAEGSWNATERFPSRRKRPGLSGPIDDAFLDPFLVVTPSAESAHPAVQRWVQCELEFFRKRWRTLFRGELREKPADQLTKADLEQFHLIAFGTPDSNEVLKQLFSHPENQLPIIWDQKSVSIGNSDYAATNHVPVCIYPNPANPNRYIVVNSGPTFRPAHDVTNSLQNPKLPDWAIISLDEPRTAEAPGGITECGFFDDLWRLDTNHKW